MTRDIQALIAQMTVEEKAGLCSGRDFWHTKGIERLGIPPLMVTDGPHGLRKQGGTAEEMGTQACVPSTCFPSGVTLASSWDRALIRQVGAAIGEECQAENVEIVLGPGLNIKRSPLCGRNFEYFSEDPYLSGEMAANHIQGVQSQGVGASPKHFAVNNQENRRFSVNAEVDERTLREIYLAGFESAITQAKPWTVMCSYNQLNGEFCSQHPYLLTDILRKEWGFEGVVMSDWGAVDRRVDGLAAGLELEMPYSGGDNDQKIVDAVKNGALPERVLDQAVERLLNIIFTAFDQKKPDAAYDQAAHHQFAREAARECMALLKNDDHILPLHPTGTIAMLGALAKTPRYQGGGSSHITPTRIDCAYDETQKLAGQRAKLTYAAGYDLKSDLPEDALLNEAARVAAEADVAVIFAGLTDSYESEGYDRTHLSMPANHLALIDAVTAVQKNVVVVLSNGSPVEMPWKDRVKGILESYLGGQASGGAVADLLFGAANPCGKLAETFPQKLAQNPSHPNFPGEGDRVEYREGLFVGYRYYDAKEIAPLFPFGHGLSYTTFEYTGIAVDKKELTDAETVTVTATVKNTGRMAGKEIAQLYVRDVESSVIRPVKELKGFEKIALAPGEEQAVTFALGKRAFAYYDTQSKDWRVESGAFEILVGSSSQSLPLKETVTVTSTTPMKKRFHQNSTIGDLLADPHSAQAGHLVLQKMTGEGGPFSNMDSFGEGGVDMAMKMMQYMTLRMCANLSNGMFSDELIDQLLRQANEVQS